MALGYKLKLFNFTKGTSPHRREVLPLLPLRSYALQFTLYVTLSIALGGCGGTGDSEAWAQEMAVANRAYEAGDFATAAARYENIIAATIEDGRVYYNLGNAYFKQNQLGLAIVNYERAHRLLPRDEDIAANLTFAQEQIVDRVEIPPPSPLERAVSAGRSLFTVNEWTWLATALYTLLSIVALGAMLWPRYRAALLYTMALLALLLIMIATALWFQIHTAPAGIVTVESVAVLSGPGENYTTEFTVHEGTKLTIVERRAAWWRVRLVGDLQGWIQATALTEL